MNVERAKEIVKQTQALKTTIKNIVDDISRKVLSMEYFGKQLAISLPPNCELIQFFVEDKCEEAYSLKYYIDEAKGREVEVGLTINRYFIELCQHFDEAPSCDNRIFIIKDELPSGVSEKACEHFRQNYESGIEEAIRMNDLDKTKVYYRLIPENFTMTGMSQAVFCKASEEFLKEAEAAMRNEGWVVEHSINLLGDVTEYVFTLSTPK